MSPSKSWQQVAEYSASLATIQERKPPIPTQGSAALRQNFMYLKILPAFQRSFWIRSPITLAWSDALRVARKTLGKLAETRATKKHCRQRKAQVSCFGISASLLFAKKVGQKHLRRYLVKPEKSSSTKYSGEKLAVTSMALKPLVFVTKHFPYNKK